MATMTDEEIKDLCARYAAARAEAAERLRCQAEQPVDVDAVAKALAEEDTIASWESRRGRHARRRRALVAKYHSVEAGR